MSILTLLLHLPQWLAVPVIVGSVVLISIIGFLAVHRLVPIEIRKLHNDVAGFVYAVVGVIYAVLLAFVVFVVWSEYNEVRITVEKENSLTLVLYEGTQLYPNTEVSQNLQQALATYAQAVVAEDRQIADLAKPRGVSGVSVSLHPIGDVLAKVAPANNHEQSIYNLILHSLNEVSNYRNLRLYAAEEKLPNAILIAMIAGAIITIGFTYLFGTENILAHEIMIGMLAAMIAIIMYVVIELDHPFLGPVSIKPPQAYQMIIEAVNAKK
jgi:Protein of unknown function (DUF4239)